MTRGPAHTVARRAEVVYTWPRGPASRTRDKRKHRSSKEVVEDITNYGVQRAQGVSVLYQMDLFDTFKVPDRHLMSKWALCKECCAAENFALAQVSRGSHDPGVITLSGVSIMLEVIAAFELRFGDGTHLAQMREGPGKQPCGYT